MNPCALVTTTEDIIQFDLTEEAVSFGLLQPCVVAVVILLHVPRVHEGPRPAVLDGRIKRIRACKNRHVKVSDYLKLVMDVPLMCLQF